MAHFSPFIWQIDIIQYSEQDLLSDPVAQSVFLHEYIHYLQTLTGTFGRCFLSELIRTMIYAGQFKVAGCIIPKMVAQIDLMHAFRNAVKADFVGSEIIQQYKEIANEVRFVLSDAVVGKMNGSRCHNHFFFQPYKEGNYVVDPFVHLEVGDIDGQICGVPLTDRILFENMARQVQRNYLLMNNSLNSSPVDSLRSSQSHDLTYVCIHDMIESSLDTGMGSSGKWTIVLCQVALMCQHPGNAFFSLWELFEQNPRISLEALLDKFRKTIAYAKGFNKPPLQNILNSMVQEYGTAIRMTENGELCELARIVANAANAFLSDPYYLSSPTIEWKTVLGWLTQFGCPPVVSKTGCLDAINGVPLASPWHSYFLMADALLA